MANEVVLNIDERESAKSKNILVLSLISALLFSFWPVLRWYFLRIIDGSDEPYGVAALLVAIGIAVRRTAQLPSPYTLVWCTGISFLYVLCGTKLPFLLQGVMLVVSLGLLLSNIFFKKTIHVGFTALLLLSLPLIASLQFFLGFPLRAITSQIVAHILSLCGYLVTASGALLHWRGEIISIDAPCAGIRMLWSGLFLHFTLSTLRGISPSATLLGYTFSMAVIFCGNLLRTLLLFFTESKIVHAPEWMHAGIGVFCFLGVCLGIFAFHSFQCRRETCA